MTVFSYRPLFYSLLLKFIITINTEDEKINIEFDKIMRARIDPGFDGVKKLCMNTKGSDSTAIYFFINDVLKK